MKVLTYCYGSSVSHIHYTEPLNHSTSMMITDVEFSLKKEWVRKLKLIPLANNSRDTSLESMAVLIKMVFQ